MADRLIYHQDSYNLLGRRAVFSWEALSRVLAREQSLGVTFPPSVREWYAQQDAIDILLACIYADEPYPIEELGERWEVDESDPFHGMFNDPAMLLFMCDNHGGIVYAFRIDGSEDPPVYTHDDDAKWTKQADTFSRFLFLLVWHSLANQLPYQATAQSAPVDSRDLAMLLEQLETVRPALHDSPVLRFQRDSQYLVIAPFDASSTWYWTLSAATEEGLEVLKQTTLRCRYSDLNPRYAKERRPAW